MQNRQPRSRTLLDYNELRPTDLESVLGASPREFESRILRHADLQEHPMMTAGLRASRVEWSHLVVSILGVERRLHRIRRNSFARARNMPPASTAPSCPVSPVGTTVAPARSAYRITRSRSDVETWLDSSKTSTSPGFRVTGYRSSWDPVILPRNADAVLVHPGLVAVPQAVGGQAGQDRQP